MSEQNRPRNAVILGGGLAGLSAAIRLKERGVENVVVLEREPRLGGLAISLQYEGLTSDLGPHRIYTEIPEVEAFYREIASPSMITVRRSSSMFLEGKFLHYPLRIVDLLEGPGVVRVAGFGFSWLAAHTKNFLQKGTKKDFESYMISAFGRQLYGYIIKPFTEKVWKTEASQLDADAARTRVSAGSMLKMVKGMFLREKKGKQTALREFHYLRGGAQTLVNHLVERAHVLGVKMLVGHEAVEFRIGEGGRIEAVEAQAGEERKTFPADAVISTIPYPQLFSKVSRVLPMPPETIRQVEALRFLDIIFVYIIVRRELIRGHHWIYFPEPSYLFHRASESKAFDPEMGQPNRSLLCVEITCHQGDEFANLSDDEIGRKVIEQMTGTNIFAKEEVAATYIHRLPFGYPIYDLNYSERVEESLREMSRVPNLVTTGRQGLFSFNNMDHSIFMGMKAADCCVGSANPAKRWLSDIQAFKSFRIVD